MWIHSTCNQSVSRQSQQVSDGWNSMIESYWWCDRCHMAVTNIKPEKEFPYADPRKRNQPRAVE